MRFYILSFILSALILICTNSFSQSVLLTNPSFEDEPRANKVPEGWRDCGYIFPGETPPDIQPSGMWKVTKEAKDGRTYVGLVVRDNSTYESLGQKLKGILRKDVLYQFDILICTSETYMSPTRRTSMEGILLNFTTPAKLRIWGGNQMCHKSTLLAESPLLKNHNWKLYRFNIKPIEEVSYIMFEAYYENEISTPYNGNILIDGATAFTPISQIISSQNPVEE